MLKSYIIVLFLFYFCISTCAPIQAQENPAIALVNKYIDLLNKNEWSAIPDLWIKDQQEDLIDFIGNKKNEETKIGLLNIKKAELVKWKELPYDNAKNYLPTSYVERFVNPKIFYVGVNYFVHKEDEFHINGINYFLVVVALQEGKWKIAIDLLAPVNSIIADGYGFGTDDEKTFDERRLKFKE